MKQKWIRPNSTGGQRWATPWWTQEWTGGIDAALFLKPRATSLFITLANGMIPRWFFFLWRSTVSSYESKCPSALWGEGCDRELPNQVSHRINTWQVMPLGSRLNQFRQKDSINEWNSLPGSHTINTASVNSAWVRTAPCAKKSWPVSGSGTKAVKIIIRNKPNFLKKKGVLKWTKYGFDIQKGLFFYSNVANSASLISSPKLE